MSFWDALGNSAASAAGGLIGSAANALFANQQVHNNKKLMRYQNMLNRQNYQDQRKDALADYARQRNDYISDLLNADKRSTQSRRNAGLSISFGEGYSAAQPLGQDIRQSELSMPNASASMASASNIDTSGSGFAQNRLFESQKANIDADTQKKLAETKGQQTANEILSLDLQKYKDTYDTQVSTLNQTLDNLRKDGKIKDKQYDEIATHITKLNSEIANLNFDVESLKPQQLLNLKEDLQKIKATITNLNSQSNLNDVERSIKEIQKRFNDMGIGVGSGLFDSVLGLLTSGNGNEVFEQLKSFVGNIFSGIVNIDFGEVIAKGVGSLFGTGVKSVRSLVAAAFGEDVANEIDNAPANIKKWIDEHIKGKDKSKSK